VTETSASGGTTQLPSDARTVLGERQAINRHCSDCHTPVEPDRPLAKVEPVGVERRAGVAGQVSGNRPVSELTAGVEIDDDQFASRRCGERRCGHGVDMAEAPLGVYRVVNVVQHDGFAILLTARQLL
jgi:hypothetical protein